MIHPMEVPMTPRTLVGLSLAAGLLILAGTACAPPRMAVAVHAEPGLEGWERAHPEAARDLGAWVREHPDAARQFFAWDGEHPERAHEFVTWSITHRDEGIRAFAERHRHWGTFDVIMRDHQPAANAFMGWTRHHPEAAEALMRHPGGLNWAGHHLYASFWRP
jgi:hypothetical protein